MKDLEASEELARNASIPDHIVCKAIELKPGDIIIHNYSKLRILKCGPGGGASNEFGDYFWIKGVFVSDFNCSLQEFWSFQECPVIKLLYNS